ncbi:MAG: FtsX-like permease family protein [Bacteroidota bacterium]
MGIFIKVALRNIIRHWGRNTLVGSSIALATGLFLFTVSLSTGIERQMIGNLVQIETGAVSFSLSDSLLKKTNKEQQQKLVNLKVGLKNIPDVSGLRERLYSRALIHVGNRSTDINLRGVDWAKESALFSSLRFNGTQRKDSLQAGLLISESVAKKLDVGINDPCSIMLQTVQGSLNLDEYSISGIYRNISGWANTMVFLNIDEAKVLLNSFLPTHILIDTENLNEAPSILLKTKGLLQQEFKDTMDIASYKDRASFASTISNANKYGFLSIVFFLQVISFFGIGFVVHNNLIERNKEIGTLLAIGFTPRNIRFSFLFETLAVAAIASLIGLLLFGGLILFLSGEGIFLGDSATLIFGSNVLKPFFRFTNLLIALAIGLVYPLLSGLWSTRSILKANPIQLIYDR